MPAPTKRLALTFHENAGFLATNLGHENTGIKGAVLWIFAGEPTRDESVLGPRLWIAEGAAFNLEGLSNAVVLTLSSPPEVRGSLSLELERKALQFVEANRDVLMRYWRGRMATRQMIDLLVRV